MKTNCLKTCDTYEGNKDEFLVNVGVILLEMKNCWEK